MNRRIVEVFGSTALAIVFALAALPASAQQSQPPAPGQPGAVGETPKPRPVRKDRVFVKDLEGLWITRDYVEALRSTRQPLEAARKASPIVIKIQKDARGFPILRTDFNKAVLLKVVEIEPEGAPDAFRIVAAANDSGAVSSLEATYIRVRGKKSEQGRFEALSMSEPAFSKKRFRDYIRADEGLAALVNGLTVAGSYLDENKRSAVFTRAGEATLGNEKFAFEVSLATKGVPCNMIESATDPADGPKRRIGFAWKSGKLQLFEVTDAGAGGLKCGTKPTAVLDPQAEAPAGGKS